MTITKIRKQRLQWKIQEARATLLLEKPVFGLLLMYLKFVAVNDIRNISTNGRCIFFNPDFVDKLPPYELQFVLCHQIMHIVNGDIWRSEDKRGDEYHRAYDVKNNNKLFKLGWSESGLTHLGKVQHDVPRYYGNVEFMGIEQIYDSFPFKLNKLDERTRNRYMADTDFWWDYKADEGTGGVVVLETDYNMNWRGSIDADSEEIIDDEGEATQSEVADDEQIKEFWKIKSQKAKEDINKLIKGKNVGSGSENDEIVIDNKKPALLDWRKLLVDFVQEDITDYSFAPPDRRFSDSDFFLPDFNEKDFVAKDILFMADTSGSIDIDTLETVYGEISGAIEQFNGKIQGKLGFFDTEVTPPVSFESVSGLEKIIPYGGGGTDFTVIFDYIRYEMRNLPATIIVFTDGYGPYPQEDDTLGIPVLWLINNENSNPPFGKVARILPEKER